MAKDLVSFPDLTRDLGGFDLLASAARKANGETESKDLFRARILKEINTIDAAEVANMAGMPDQKGGTSQIAGTRVYFVQIIERSPHAYLPEPCSQGTTSLMDTPNNNVIQALYTIAIDQQGLRLSVDDLIYVKLNKKDFSYDTDFGWIHSKAGSGHASFRKKTQCAKANAAFKNKKLETVPGGRIEELQEDANPDVTKFIFGSNVSMDAVSIRNITTFTNMLSYSKTLEEIPELIISSGYRNATQQANAMKDLFKGRCKGNVPNGKPGPNHPCRSMYNLYGGSTKIQQLLKVDWTKGNDLAREIQEQADEGREISKHMIRGAFDLQTDRVAGRDKKDANGNRIQIKPSVILAIINAVKSFGGTAFYERSPPHVHVNIPSNILQQAAVASQGVEDIDPQTDA